MFSIILPIYNVEKYLHKCVDSILGQSYSDFELILVNDGSTDNSPNICDEYAAKDLRVKTIHKPNGGLSDARNIGLREATRKYVFFIDSDDYLIDSYVLQKIVDVLETTTDVLMFKFQKYYESTQKMCTPPFSFIPTEKYSSTVDWLLQLNNIDAFYCSAWSKVVRREILVNNNILFEKGLLGEDNDWYYGVIQCAKRFSYIDEPFIVYRQRSNSITSSTKLKNLTDLIYIIEKWNTILSKDKDNLMNKVIYAHLAKQYCSVLIMYSHIQDKNKYKLTNRIKGLSCFLSYSDNTRVAKYRKAYKVIGLSGVAIITRLVRFAMVLLNKK